MRRSEMVIDRVSSNDAPIGVVKRGDVFRRKANFRVVHVLVFRPDGRLVIQRIASDKRHPGMWGSSVAGYLHSGEKYREAATRKLAEELALTADRLDFVGKTSMVDDGCRKFIAVYKVVSAAKPKPNPEDISGLKSIALRELEQLVAGKPDRFTLTFSHVLHFYLSKNAT